MSEHDVARLRGGAVELQLRALEDAAAEHVAHQQHGAALLQLARRQQLRVPRHVRYYLQVINTRPYSPVPTFYRSSHTY